MQRRARHPFFPHYVKGSFEDDRHLRIRNSRTPVSRGRLDAGHPIAGRTQDPAAGGFHGAQPQARHRRTNTVVEPSQPEREHGHRHPRRRARIGHRRGAGPSGQGRRRERHQRTRTGAGRAAGYVEQHVARHRFTGTPPVLQGTRGAHVEGRRHRGRRRAAARPQVQRGLAVHPPERRNVPLVHAQRQGRQHAPPHQRPGDPAMELGGLPAQARPGKGVEFDHFHPAAGRSLRHSHVQGHQHVFTQNTVKPGQQRLKARHHPAGRMGARQLRAGRPPGRARRHQPAQTTIHPRGRPRPSGQGTRGRTRMGQHSRRRDGEGQRRTSARGPMRAVEDRTHDARRVQRTHPKHDCESNEGKLSASSSKH